MANLITEKQKKTIKNEYLIRLLTVSLFMISLLGIFLLAYVIPYFISVSKKDAAVADQFKSVINVENKENVGQSGASIVSQTQDELKALELYNQSRAVPSVYFAKIIASKNSNISITRLSFTPAKSNQIQFFVSGVAQTRDSLVTFISVLKSQAGFATVDSPISDFAKDSNISFTLNITTNI